MISSIEQYKEFFYLFIYSVISKFVLNKKILNCCQYNIIKKLANKVEQLCYFFTIKRSVKHYPQLAHSSEI